VWAFGAIPNALGHAASLAAYQHGQPWLNELLLHLEANRDVLVQYVGAHWPQVRVTRPEGTYLAWLDCRALGVENPQAYFLKEAKVALNDGATFGAGGQGYVRLNFGCSQTMLVKALSQMGDALVRLGN
jgi:cystathionine beta-lyase